MNALLCTCSFHSWSKCTLALAVKQCSISSCGANTRGHCGTSSLFVQGFQAGHNMIVQGFRRLQCCTGSGCCQSGGDWVGGGICGQPPWRPGCGQGGRRVLAALPQVHALRAPRLSAAERLERRHKSARQHRSAACGVQSSAHGRTSGALQERRASASCAVLIPRHNMVMAGHSQRRSACSSPPFECIKHWPSRTRAKVLEGHTAPAAHGTMNVPLPLRVKCWGNRVCKHLLMQIPTY